MVASASAPTASFTPVASPSAFLTVALAVRSAISTLCCAFTISFCMSAIAVSFSIPCLVSCAFFCVSYVTFCSSAILRSVSVFINDSGGTMSPINVSTAFTLYSSSTFLICSFADSCLSFRVDRNAITSLSCAVIVERFLSKLCASLLAEAQFKTRLVVGTSSTFMVYLLIGYFPGPNGSSQTPLYPFSTILPCLKSAPVKSCPSCPIYEITTPTKPIGISVIGVSSI